MPIERNDPQFDVRNRGRQIETADPERMDAQETAEREEAAQRYMGENEQHFVDYYMECTRESVKSNEDERSAMADCWYAYNEWEPKSYQYKEFWQSRVVIPKPFQTVQFGAAAVKKAFSPNFLSVDKKRDVKAGEFWQKVLDHYMAAAMANFVSRFGDAAIMAFAVGKSMEVIPRFIPGRGLELALVEPWKVHRDPDAMSRAAQSGLYWIHQEWLDYYVLQQGEKDGRYFDVRRVQAMDGDSAGEDPMMSKEMIAERRKQVWERSKYRKMILTGEVYGTVLDPRGEMLLPSGMYTVSGMRCIQAPTPVPYTRMRWPGTSFSPLPNILRFGGRGLLDGVLSLWDAINEIMNLHMDALKWLVNPPTEINVDGLVNPEDVTLAPGRKFLTRDTVAGQQVVRDVEKRSRTNDVLSNSQYLDQNYQRGAFVTDAVQGLPGYRKDMTFREASMNLDQALGVFGLMGESLEGGAMDILDNCVDVITNFIGFKDLKEIFSDDELKQYGIEADPDAANGVVGMPVFRGRCHVSGMQALMKDAETLKHLRETVMPMEQSPRYARYVKPYKVIKAIEARTNLMDEGVFVSEDEAKLIDMQERLAAAKQSEAVEKLARLQEALGITDLVEKLQRIDAQDIGQAVEEINLLERIYGAGSQGGSAEPGAGGYGAGGAVGGAGAGAGEGAQTAG